MVMWTLLLLAGYTVPLHAFTTSLFHTTSFRPSRHERYTSADSEGDIKSLAKKMRLDLKVGDGRDSNDIQGDERMDRITKLWYGGTMYAESDAKTYSPFKSSWKAGDSATSAGGPATEGAPPPLPVDAVVVSEGEAKPVVEVEVIEKSPPATSSVQPAVISAKGSAPPSSYSPAKASWKTPPKPAGFSPYKSPWKSARPETRPAPALPLPVTPAPPLPVTPAPPVAPLPPSEESRPTPIEPLASEEAPPLPVPAAVEDKLVPYTPSMAVAPSKSSTYSPYQASWKTPPKPTSYSPFQSSWKAPAVQSPFRAGSGWTDTFSQASPAFNEQASGSGEVTPNALVLGEEISTDSAAVAIPGDASDVDISILALPPTIRAPPFTNYGVRFEWRRQGFMALPPYKATTVFSAWVSTDYAKSPVKEFALP